MAKDETSDEVCAHCSKPGGHGRCKVCQALVCSDCAIEHSYEHRERPLENLALGAERIAKAASGVADLARTLESKASDVLASFGLRRKRRGKGKS